ncbi:MFS transporter [soil metagenome]
MSLRSPAISTRGFQIFTFVAVIAFALNLRTAAASIGVVLPAIQSDLGMGATLAGVLVTLPLLCFAILGSTTGGLARTFGIHKTMLFSLALVALGSIVRSFAPTSAMFIVATIVALVGTAIGNVFLPPLVKMHFPRHIAQVSSLFVAATMLGAAMSAALTAPLADLLGDWRNALLFWGILAAVTLVPWLFMMKSDSHHDFASHGQISFKRMAHSRLAWSMAVFFSLQSAQAYVGLGWLAAILIDAGNSESTAGIALGISAATGVPISLMLPRIMRRFGATMLVPLGCAISTAACWIGILIAPTTAPWLWGLLLGIGSAAFPWTISLISLRSDTVAGTAALSGFVQTMGYLIAGIAPFGVALLHDATGTWTPSVAVMAAICVPFALIGMYLVRAPQLEATLPPERILTTGS